MKITLSKLLAFLFLVIAAKQTSYAQLTVPNYTACPNQVINVTATWNNVSSITYSLYGPPNGFTGPPIQTPASNTFTLSNNSAIAATIVYTLVGNGVFLSNPITSTAVFSLTIVPPAPMTITNQQFYCSGSTATLTAPIGGVTYSYTGAGITGTNSSNVITIPGVQSGNNGGVTIVSVIGGCTVSGVTNLSVAPLLLMSVSANTNVCQGGCTTLTASLPGGTSYQWYDNYNAPILSNPSPNPANYAICPAAVVNSGTYQVTAIQQFNGQSCVYTSSTQVNVVQTNPVTVSASPNNVVCQGTALNLIANAGSATSWLWSGPGFSSASQNPVISPALPTNTGSYSVTATFQGAFIACTTSAVVGVTVVPVSAPVITMPSSVCKGDNFIVTGAAASNPVSYNWSGPLFTGTVANTGTSIPVSDVPVNASGTQFLTVKFGTGGQCSATSSVQLNVVPINTISVVPPGTICSPDNAFLQALATGATQYQWAGPNGYANQGPNVWVYYPTSAASGIYTVTAFFSTGNLVCSNTNTVQLTVNPVLTFSLIPRQQLCYNSSVTISGPSGATSYTWTSSTGFTSNDKDITFTSAQPSNSGTYTLNVSLGPCQSSANSEIVVLSPLAFTLTPFDRTICRGDTIFLEGGATGGSENYAFTWNPSVYLESSTGSQQMAIPLGSVLYNLIVYDIACPNYTIAHAFNVKVNQPPIPTLQLAQGEGCVPLCLPMDSVVKRSAITTFDFGGNRVFQHDSADFTYCLDEPGTYNLKIYTKGYNGCGNTFEYPYPIVVNPKPGTDVYWNPEIPTTNDELTFYPTFKSEPIVYYSWNFLGGVTEGDTTMNNSPGMSDTTDVKNPKRTYAQIGTYPVVLIAQNDKGCTDTVYKLVNVIDELQIYVPNSFTPNDDGVNDLFMAKGTGMKLENFSMDIFNRAGVNIFTTKDINQGWDGKVGGQIVKDATYIYKIKVVGMNGEGRKELTGYFTLIK